MTRASGKVVDLHRRTPGGRPGMTAEDSAQAEAALDAIIIRLARQQALADHLAAMQPRTEST